MASLLVMYKTPIDPVAFDAHYQSHHIPLAKALPGLRGFEISEGPVATPAGPSGFYRIATLRFDDLAAIQAAFASPQGQAAAADVANFATGGVEMMMFDDQPA